MEEIREEISQLQSRLKSFTAQLAVAHRSVRSTFDGFVQVIIYYTDLILLTFSSLDLPLSSHPLQAANCCRNSRLVVNEDDFMWFKNYRKLPCIGKPVSWKFSF